MTESSRPHLIRYSVTLGVLCLLSACGGGFHKKWSDREVFSILKSKSSRVPNSGTDLLSIMPPKAVDLEKMVRNTKLEEFLGDRAVIEKDAKVLGLPEALGLGVGHNRTYLGQKESVYLIALDLTLARHQFAPIASGIGSGTYVGNNVEGAINQFTTEHTITSNGSIGFSKLTSIGTRIAADLSTDFVRFFTGGVRNLGDSKLAVTLAQPLLRGAGSLSVTEPLTQAERDVLYSIRDFTQYRKSFAIDIASAYYQALQSRDAARNAYVAYSTIKDTLVAQKALVDATRPGKTQSALGLLQQAELSYHRRWIAAVKLYEENLDSLKLELAIPVTQPLMLDQGEMDRLELMDPPGTLDEALETAVVTRLDLWNARDARDDALRQVKVAEHDLLPGLDVKGAYNVKSDPKSEDLNIDGKRRDFSVGLDLDLHLDQKPSRNALRAAQIKLQKADRDLELAQETVRKDVRASWRNLDVARKQYAIAEKGLEISEVRLERERAMFEVDRSSSRDLIDAQQALNDARDQRIAALVNHTIARLQLWKNMGILFIRKDGSWADVLAKETPKGQGS